MKRKLIVLLICICSTTLIACSNNSTNKKTNKRSTSFSTEYVSSSKPAPFILQDTTYTTQPFIFIDTNTLLFPNWDDKNRISTIEGNLPSNYIRTEDATSFIDYRTNSMTYINGTIYFSDYSNNYYLSSVSTVGKDIQNLLNIKTDYLTSINNTIYFINKDYGYSLYKYDINSKELVKLTNDKVGKYCINNSFILYQNISDNSKLYRINIDGTNRTAVTDFAVDSFCIYQNTIIAINSYDNYKIYQINPSDLSTKRISLIEAKDIQCYNNNIYYLDRNKNHLCLLSIDTNSNNTTSSELFKEGVNEYYPSQDYIFIKKSANINNTYIYIYNLNAN